MAKKGAFHMIRAVLLLTAIYSTTSHAFNVNPGLSGSWYNASRSGEGFILEVINDQSAVVYWFTYDPQGNQQWMVGVGQISGSTITFDDLLAPVGGKFGPQFDPDDVVRESWGTLVMEFSSCDSASTEYSGPGSFGSGRIEVVRLTGIWGVDCQGNVGINPTVDQNFLNPGFSGSWYDPTHSGEGFIVEVLNQTTVVIYWFTFDKDGNQAWMVGLGEINGATIFVGEFLRPVGAQFGPSFDPDDVDRKPWGPGAFSFGSCGNGATRYLPPVDFGVEDQQLLVKLVDIQGVPCELLTDVYDINGVMEPDPFLYTDGDVNSPLSREIPNGLDDPAQPISSPATIVGYLTATPTGTSGDRFENRADEWDTYIVPLREGEQVRLEIADWNDSNVSPRPDFDLYLVDSVDVVDSSLSVDQVELVTAPRDDFYFIAVNAFEGRGNYRLRTGLTGASGSSTLSVVAPMATRELMATAVPRQNLTTMSFDSSLQRIRDAEAEFGLEVKQGGASGAKLYAIKSRSVDKLLPHPLTLAGFGGITADAWQVVRAAKRLSQIPEFDHVGPNYALRTLAVPNDPGYFLQKPHYELIRLPQAWEITTGSRNIVVAVIDGGVSRHPDLLGNTDYSLGFDFVENFIDANDGDGLDFDASDPGPSFPQAPYSSHGTHVAGTVASDSNNGIWLSGAAWRATLMPIRVFGVSGGANQNTFCFRLNEALKWSGRLQNITGFVPSRAADVVNLSLGGSAPCQGTQTIINRLTSQGTIVVAASGNDSGFRVNYPASFTNVVSVAATGFRDYLAPYSTYNEFVDIAAPGGDVSVDLDRNDVPDGVVSTALTVDRGSNQRSFTFDVLQGTSMAAPHVSGVAALMKSVYPQMSTGQFMTALANGRLANDIGPAGYDPFFGYGRIDALKAVSWASQQAGNPPSAFMVSSIGSVLFDAGTQSVTVEISKGGSGPLSIETLLVTDSWISISPINLDGENFGTFRIDVDRGNLIPGQYVGAAGFEASDGTILGISLTMQVGEPVVGDTGVLIGLLLDPLTQSNNNQWIGDLQNGRYEINLPENVPGDFFLLIGSDLDNDFTICDEGEYCQFYPNLSDVEVIELSNENADLGLFRVNAPPTIVNGGGGDLSLLRAEQVGGKLKAHESSSARPVSPAPKNPVRYTLPSHDQ